uniref:Conserved plasma membrane protein n=1 Tax=Angiostrongylus cantonensis TaxID=6313 RepID=A0A158PC59_ANGCA
LRPVGGGGGGGGQGGGGRQRGENVEKCLEVSYKEFKVSGVPDCSIEQFLTGFGQLPEEYRRQSKAILDGAKFHLLLLAILMDLAMGVQLAVLTICRKNLRDHHESFVQYQSLVKDGNVGGNPEGTGEKKKDGQLGKGSKESSTKPSAGSKESSTKPQAGSKEPSTKPLVGSKESPRKPLAGSKESSTKPQAASKESLTKPFYAESLGSDKEENHVKYLACFGTLHVKHVAPTLIVIRTLILFILLIYMMITTSNDLLSIYGLFCFCTAMTSNVSLLAGMQYKRYVKYSYAKPYVVFVRCNFLLPYFFIATLFIISLVLHLFISLLNTANTKDTLQPGTLLKNLTVFGILCFEVYTILSVWRIFVYICDARMDRDVKRAKIVAKRLQRLGRRTEGELIAIIINGDSEK